MVKNTPSNAGDIGDMGSIPESRRSPGGGQGSPLQYSCLENPMDREASWDTVRRIRVRDACSDLAYACTCCRVDGSVLT